MLPEVHDVVLMVASVQMHVVGVQKEEGKQNDDNLCRFLSSIHKVSIEYVGVLRRGQTVLGNKAIRLECKRSQVMPKWL